MCHHFLGNARFWLFLLDVDKDLAEQAREERCPRCQGPLYAAHYGRKPRGLPEGLGAEFSFRLSLCCGREGCRKRRTPPSVRFLGPKVYVGVLVVLVTAMRQGATRRGARELERRFGADRRTLARWQRLWLEIFPRTNFWLAAKARFMPPVDEALLPLSFFERFEADTLERKLGALLLFLSPITVTGGLAVHDP
jgi:hypothetical protein